MGRGSGPGGVKVTLKHVHRFKDRHGKARHYLRLAGVKAVALPGDPGSPEFMAAYQRAVDAYVPPGTASPSKAAPGSMRDLAERYYRTGKFLDKKPYTQYVERGIIDRFTKEHGDKRAATMLTRHVDLIMAGMRDRPAAAMNLRKRLRALFKLAIKLGWRSDDPTAASDTFKLGTWHTWTDDEVAQFEARWPRDTKQRLAFDLLVYTGQRSGDARRLTWQAVAGGKVRMVQCKTGTAVVVPIHAGLAETLALHKRDVGVIVVTQAGKPFTEHGFGNWMADAIKAAGLPDHCVTHGLRKAAARRLAECGCTAHEIASITGHKSLKEVQRYTEAADREHLADAAMAKVAGQRLNIRLANVERKPDEK